jgi:peptide/nickel transport system permease protein
MTTVVPGTADVRASPRLPVPRFLRSGEGALGLVLFTLIVATALIGPLVAPHPLGAPIGPPGSPPGHGALLGTDILGRDVFSRVLDGGVSVLWLSAATMALTYAIGGTIGMAAGLSQSWLDSALMRVVDLFLVFPPLLLLLLLITGAGTGEGILVLGIVAVLFPGVARIVRTATLETATTGYVEAAVGRGERTAAIMRREIFPNIVPVMLADFGVRFSAAIVLAASVNFLGLGAKPPTANWGLMVAENRLIIGSNLWAVLVPAAMLGLLTVSVNLLGDAYVRSIRRGGGA